MIDRRGIAGVSESLLAGGQPQQQQRGHAARVANLPVEQQSVVDDRLDEPGSELLEPGRRHSRDRAGDGHEGIADPLQAAVEAGDLVEHQRGVKGNVAGSARSERLPEKHPFIQHLPRSGRGGSEGRRDLHPLKHLVGQTDPEVPAKGLRRVRIQASGERGQHAARLQGEGLQR